MKIQIDLYAMSYVLIATAAPLTYDGCGTIQVFAADGSVIPGRRVVLIEEPHLGWQTTRYESGGYPWAGVHEPRDVRACTQVLHERLRGASHE